MHTQELITCYLAVTPGAVTRLGRGMFVEVPLYRAKRKCRPVYINRTAYQDIFGGSTSWDDMSETLTTLFSTTIEPEHAIGEAIATAYADRQSDPLDLSLAGNQGSGRAYYAGALFNIKGERTPLATATKKQFSDGFLEMERAMWETLVANGLQGAISTGLNDVLAIIDMDDTCEVSWRDKPVKRAKVIRLDRDHTGGACLDRVTHLFHAPRALDAQTLHATASSYGHLEADKFCQRIIHGTWSPGNISLQGHLIDFDTVCATKGRAPLYSSTRWYHQNRFGFEHGGQAAILAALADHAVINADGVTAQDLQATMMQALQHKTALNFIALMGFDDAAAVYARHREDIESLCALWQEISRKAYLCHDAFILKDLRAHHAHVFDTAFFMAIYPLALRIGQFNAQQMLQAILDNEYADTLMEPLTNKALSEIEQQHQDAVDAVIGEHMVSSDTTRTILSMAALAFIKKYDRIFRSILDDTQDDILRVEARALARNEDRHVLFPALTATFRIGENAPARSAAHIDSIIASMVESCRQHLRDGTPVIQHHVCNEGHFCLTLNGKGQHRLRFAAHAGKIQPTEIKWENEIFSLDGQGYSPPRDNALLWPLLEREASLHAPEITLYSQIEHIKKEQSATPL